MQQEHDLDSNLLSGELDVDAYAAALLRQSSLEHALRELEEIRKERDNLKKLMDNPVNLEEVQQLKKERNELHAKLTILSSTSNRRTSFDTEELEQLRREKQELLDKLQSLSKDGSTSTATGDKKRKFQGENSWYEETFAEELKEIDSVQDKIAQEEEKKLEAELQAITQERDELIEERSQFELKWNAMEELNNTLSQKISYLENTMTQQDVQSEEISQISDNFRRKALNRKYFNEWRDLAFETILSRKSETKLSRNMTKFLLLEWSRAARIIGIKRRTAVLFAKMKETQSIRHYFRAWRQLSDPASKNPESYLDMNLATLRQVAAEQRVPAMMYAASRGMINLVLELINEGSAVLMKERGTGSTPLHSAAEAGYANVVEVLLEAGADLHTKDDAGDTPLLRVAKKGPEASVDVALALLRHGADPLYVAEKDGRSLLQIAVDSGASLQFISILLHHGAIVEQQQDSSGRTALHAAASRGVVEILQVLLKHASENKPSPQEFGLTFPKDISYRKTPLHFACASESPDMPKCIASLVEAGFDVNATSLGGETALHIFCQNQTAHPSTLTCFASRAILDSQDVNGNTPLHFACSRQIRGVALELVSMGAPLYLINDIGQCPLDTVPPGFAVRLLAAIRHPPILNRADRSHRELNQCMICKDSVDVGFFGRRVADHCRRCGRLCCNKCGAHRSVLKWTTQVDMEGTPIVSSDKPVKVCQHCAEVLMEEIEIQYDNV